MKNKNPSIKTNYIYNLLYQVLAMVVILITTPYITRVLGANNLGIYSYTYSIVTYFILFGSLGIGMYGQREIAYVKDDINKKSLAFFELFYVKMVFIILSSILFYLFYCIGSKYNLYYRILLIELFFNIFDILWFYQGIENFKKVVIRNSIIKLVSMALIFLMIKKSEDIWLYFILCSFSNIIGNLSFFINLKKEVNIKYWNKINVFVAIKKHLKKILVLFIPQISMQIYTALDKVMIGVITSNMNYVSYYDQAQKIVKLALMILTAYGTIIYSKMSFAFAKEKKDELNECVDKAFDFIWFFSMPIMFGIIGISSKFVPWYFGDEFLPVIKIMCYFSPIILIVGVSNVIYTQYMISTKKEKQFSNAIILGSIVNFFGNLILINAFGTIGAVMASVIAEFVILSVEIYYCRKQILIFDNILDSFKYLIAGIIMCISIIKFGSYMKGTIITTLIQIFIGVLIYCICLIIMKEKNINYYISKVVRYKNEKIRN